MPALGHCTPVKKQPNPTTEPDASDETFSDDPSDPPAEPLEPEVTFASLKLSPRILQTIAALGFERPTPIQATAIPSLLEGRDLVGQARTGTGKTAAFGLPLIMRLSKGKARGLPRAIVLTPTRELALQVTEALRQFAEGGSLRFLTVYGGSAYGPQLRGLREGVDVVVGTPGRVIDLMERGDLKLGEVEMAVLDEADEMLEMGFIEAVETILAGTPEATRQVALFSATMPSAIRKVAERYLKDPINVKETSQTVIAIEQRYVQVPPRFKREALLSILRSEDRGATLVFASTRASCAEAADALAVAGIPAEPLHGDLSQPARERVIELLRARRVEVVVATDIAARGIDIEHLTHIINLDLPKNVEVYTHRIGRTGRAGRSGKAITLVVPRESLRFTEALRRRGVQIEEMFIASEHELATRQRETVIGDLKALVVDAKRSHAIDEAREWASALIEAGTPQEDLVAGLLAMMSDDKNLRLGDELDRGLPPWARQPAQARMEKAAADARAGATRKPFVSPSAAGKAPARDYADAKSKRPARSEHASDDLGSERGASPSVGEREAEPQGEGFVVIGIGRNHSVRPADLVGALTNELGLTGRDIGRVEIRDTTSVISVPAAFAARVGDDSWPVTIRRVDTTVQRFEAPAPTRAVKKPFERAPSKPTWSPHDPRPARIDEAHFEPAVSPSAAVAPKPVVSPSAAVAAKPVVSPWAAVAAKPVVSPWAAVAPKPARAARSEDAPRPSTRAPRAPDTEPTRARPDRPTPVVTPLREARLTASATREPDVLSAPPEARRSAPPETHPEPRPSAPAADASPRRPAPIHTRAAPDARRPSAADTRPGPADTRRPGPADPRPPDARRPGPADTRTADARRSAPAADARRPSSPVDTRRPTKRPPAKTAGDRPPRRAVDVAPRTPRTPR